MLSLEVSGMYGVCPYCRIDHPVEINAERDKQGEYVETKCIVCGSTFVIRKQRVVCPHCNSEVFLVPRVVEMEKTRLIYENQPISVKQY